MTDPPRCSPYAGQAGVGSVTIAPMPDSARERYRRAASGKPDHRGRGRRTGHAAMFRLDQVVELGDFAEGGGFPSRFLVDVAYPTLGVTDPAQVLHICSGSVRAPFTVDRRPSVRPAVVAGP